MMKPLREIKLLKFGACDYSWSILKTFYKEVLHKDKYWHFFWEGDYTVVRCTATSAKAIKKIIKRLRKNDGVPLDYQDVEYKENIPSTIKHLDSFISIFHGFSVIAITMEKGTIEGTLERINHCFLNMICMTEDAKAMREFLKKEGSLKISYETMLITKVVLSRSFMDGYWDKYYENKK